MKTPEEAAKLFVLQAIQEWRQSDEERIAAVQDVLDSAGFKAKAEGWPVFGGIWTKKCSGEEDVEASFWLQHLTDTMPRGKFEDEVWHVKKAIETRNPAGGKTP